jgi:acyl dehydratase
MGGRIGGPAGGSAFYFIKPVFIGDTLTCTATILEMEASRRVQGTSASCFTLRPR